MPAPRKNRNAITTGIYSFFTTGRLPRGASYISRLIRAMRAELEAATAAAHGEVSIPAAGLIQSAARHEAVALMLTRSLRLATDAPLSDRLAMMKEIRAATDSRDRCIRELKIDRPAALEPWRVPFPVDPSAAKPHVAAMAPPSRPSEPNDQSHQQVTATRQRAGETLYVDAYTNVHRVGSEPHAAAADLNLDDLNLEAEGAA